jgi:hypothetical protein
MLTCIDMRALGPNIYMYMRGGGEVYKEPYGEIHLIMISTRMQPTVEPGDTQIFLRCSSPNSMALIL